MLPEGSTFPGERLRAREATNAGKGGAGGGWLPAEYMLPQSSPAGRRRAALAAARP